MKAGDIVFVRGNTPLSRIIKFFDKGEFSHVAIAVSDTEIIEAQYGIKSRIVPQWYKDIVVVDIGLSDEQREQIVDVAPDFVGKNYDYKSILWYFIESLLNFQYKNLLNSPNDYICSELVDLILFEVGAIPEDDYLGDKTPNELYKYLKNNFNIS